MRYAAETAVSVARSRAEIEETVVRYGADQFGTALDSAARQAMVQFRIREWMVRFVLPLPDPKDRALTHFRRGRVRVEEVPRSGDEAHRRYEQACRQRWRALALAIKAKLEAVECGITTFEEEFLAHLVVPGSGRTVGDHLVGQLEDLRERHGVPQITGF
jgi:hypothetical protein